MKQTDLYIYDYNFGHSDKLGFLHLDQEVFSSEMPKGIRSYSFHVKAILHEDLKELGFSFIRSRQYESQESIYGNYIGDLSLKKYLKPLKTPKWAKDTDNEEDMLIFNWEKFLQLHFPESLQLAKERLIRKKNKIIPEPVIYNGHPYYNGYEFLEFDNITCHSWAGPHSFNNKEGCLMKLHHRDTQHKYPTLDVENDFVYRINSYDLRISTAINIDELKKKSPDERRSVFRSLDIKLRNLIAKNYYQSFVEDIDEDGVLDLPYNIYLCGTDDCSYSKWFATEQDMNKEVEYLRMMQPLNFFKDIIHRKYIFTN